ncbi:MltA domain protein [Gloeothece citriformis PCC 7424]|uniref:peptidoglycan lytic exotransglycosylase n=1 Tax=Gloeothece citriformis (strain PCC 7424) TaxID=65393 RepID=B7K7N4_GLOC7|nr:murein transglycosylase A [Gloeothece citriformis]ACK69802.1 MltA domain protein [Gloeothece citriformis PCC 7424]
MRNYLISFSLGLGILFLPANFMVAQNGNLVQVEQDEDISLFIDEQLWNTTDKPGDKAALLKAIDHSLRYLNTPSAEKAYSNYPIPGITRDRVRRSLIRFRQLLVNSRTPQELQAAVKREFVLYRSLGNDNQGTVHFTGYFEPIYRASRVPTADYRYPLYRKPSNFTSWKKPHPTRLELEGDDGLLGKKSLLSGYELVWLKDRLEAYLVQVQGSAKLILPDGKMMTVGYDGTTDYPYVSLGKELINDGIFQPDELSLPILIDYLQKNPEKLKVYIPRNNRYIFFRETNGAPAQGSIGVPVTAERSIATDKSIMPPGGLALINTRIPYLNNGVMETRRVSRYVLDQDTGSAIKGAGRVDIFMGTGKEAGDRAGLISNTGELYYLLLKN